MDRYSGLVGEEGIVDRLICDIWAFERRYKREAVDQLLKHKEAAIPELFGVLQEILDEPEIVFDQDLFGWAYAISILGHEGIEEAHEYFIELAKKDEEYINAVFGDVITEDFSYYLFNTSGGNDKRIRALIEDPGVYLWSRVAAVEALRFIAEDREEKRDEIIRYLTNCIVKPSSDEESLILENVILELAYLLPTEDCLKRSCEAYDERWVTGELASKREIEAIHNGQDRHKSPCLESERERDIHSRMEWWACFAEGEGSEPVLTACHDSSATYPELNKPFAKPLPPAVKAKKKNKRKDQKKARKRNRKR